MTAATSPYLNQPLRSLAEVLATRKEETHDMPSKIIITMEGGVIQNISLVSGEPVEIEVHDYDIENEDIGAGCAQDSNGDWYAKGEWTAE